MSYKILHSWLWLALLWLTINLPLVSQSDFAYNLTRDNSNKIVLLGNSSTEDTSKWRTVLQSEDIFIHGFVLLNRARLTEDPVFGIKSNEVEAFDNWLRQKYDLTGIVTWVAMDRDNKLIVAGAQIPDAKQFDQMLEQNGMLSPQKIVRTFLLQNPDHLDAKSDLLTEARRRALQRMPINTIEDLDDITDLRTWAVLANETDKVFSAPWRGIDIRFFRPDQDQPERFSKLMRNVFNKHIASVEFAIREQPTDTVLWNIWAWMARGIGDYKWDVFLNSIEPFHFSYSSMCPSPDVCVWLIAESRQKGDWDTVLKYARIARGFSRVDNAPKAEWMPGSGTTKFDTSQAIKDYPVKSAWAPNLEALLRLGRITEANDLFDEMIRVEGRRGRSVDNQSNNAQMAADVAKSLGMDELATVWQQGQQISKIPYLTTATSSTPRFYIIARFGSDYYQAFLGINAQLSSPLTISTGPEIGQNLPWEQGDGKERWVLLSGDQRILAYDTSLPNVTDLQYILDSHRIKDTREYCRNYISEHGPQPGLELYLAFELIRNNIEILRNDQNATSSTKEKIESQWNDATARLRRIMANHTEVFFNLPYIWSNNVHIDNESMKSLSRLMMENIENLLRKRPSLESMWNQWFFWRTIEGVARPIEPLMEAIEPSPLAMPGTVPPASALDFYLQECKQNEQWVKVIKLLIDVWDREYERVTRSQAESNRQSSTNRDANSQVAAWYERNVFQANRTMLGDRVGIPLIEAYLNDHKPNDANDIFNAWLDCGGKFTNISKIVELAHAKQQDRLAREWEEKHKKQ